ncbi:MAG: glycosyltransferase family 4 protein [Acidimicrobiales bacterium]|jgi:phosphatidylinositol alpha-mannosyltransferase
MRIALVCPYSCTVPGGVQTQVLGLSRALAEGGDDVAVLAPGDKSAIKGRLDVQALHGAVFTPVGSAVGVSVNGSRAPVSPWPSTMARTTSALRAFSPEVVHVHEPLVPGPSLATLLSPKCPLVGTFHRSGSDRGYRAYGHLLGPFARRLDAVFAVSEQARATAESCVGGLSGRVQIITNGVELQASPGISPWPTEAPTVIFVGRHEQRKGLKVLLEAFSRLQADAVLWVLGQGPETGRLRARFGSQPRIEWAGAPDDTERARRLAGADVLVAPSLGGESFGVVLLEAMAGGTAVVASDLPGYRLAAGGAARLVAPGDPVALAAAVSDLLRDEPSRQALVDKGRERARECDMAAVAGLYREVYARLRRAGPE